MARTHSPGYPSIPLPKAIGFVRRLFEADRKNEIDRAVAAKHMGYSGQSGASDKALASLAHYGLVEKAGKGATKVSQLAIDILHPDPHNAVGKASALLHAGMNPQVFKDIRDRFGDHVSEPTLRSYLIRANFQDIAINPVINSYMETCRFLEQEKAFESGGSGDEIEPESDPEAQPEPDIMQTAPIPPAAPPPSPNVVMAMLGLNKINMNIQGDKVTLAATLDYRGLAMLEKKIARLKALMEPEDDDPFLAALDEPEEDGSD